MTLGKQAGLAQHLLNVAMPMSHSPGIQASLLAAAQASIHGMKIKGMAAGKLKHFAKRLKLRKALRAARRLQGRKAIMQKPSSKSLGALLKRKAGLGRAA